MPMKDFWLCLTDTPILNANVYWGTFNVIYVSKYKYQG